MDIFEISIKWQNTLVKRGHTNRDGVTGAGGTKLKTPLAGYKLHSLTRNCDLRVRDGLEEIIIIIIIIIIIYLSCRPAN
jgi:hypothetical protein